jgi:hypothetical protein
MASKNTVQISANISPESRQILERVAAKMLYNEGAQRPLGQVVTANGRIDRGRGSMGADRRKRPYAFCKEDARAERARPRAETESRARAK